MATVETTHPIFPPTEALSDVCRRFHVRRLELFGSAATGRDFDPARSDLDFVVSFEDLESRSYLDAYFGLCEALETLSTRPVDLLTEDSIKNPYLRRRIDSERRLLFQAP